MNANEVDMQLKITLISMLSKVKVCDQQRIDKLGCDLLKRTLLMKIKNPYDCSVAVNWSRLNIFTLWKYYVLNYVHTEWDVITGASYKCFGLDVMNELTFLRLENVLF